MRLYESALAPVHVLRNVHPRRARPSGNMVRDLHPIAHGEVAPHHQVISYPLPNVAGLPHTSTTLTMGHNGTIDPANAVQ